MCLKERCSGLLWPYLHAMPLLRKPQSCHLHWTGNLKARQRRIFLAIDKGYFAESELDVTIEAGSGSVGTIPKIATGAFPVGFGDINSLIKFLDQNPGAPVTAVMMVYDKPPFAIVGRKSQGVSAPKDLKAKRLVRRHQMVHGLNSQPLLPQMVLI